MPTLLPGIATALGAGLLIGLMRERRRNDPQSGPSIAGIRTHAVAAVAAAVAWHLDASVFFVLLLISGALVVVSYHRTATADVGLTSEYALLLTVLLGAMAVNEPGFAAALAVVAASLLHLRNELHHLGRELISEQEVRDGLLLAAAALIVLPVLPREAVDPWGVIVPADLWTLVVLVMAAGVGGQVAVRLVGARFGLSVAGFFSGFASSTAATASYGQRARESAAMLHYAASAALFANLATLLLLCAVLATGNSALLRVSAWPLTAMGLTLLVAGSANMLGGRAHRAPAPVSEASSVFKLSHALLLVTFVATLLVIAALLSDAFGEQGAIAAAAVAGTVELQGAALVIDQLTASGRVALADARWGLVILLASSSAVKTVVAFASGGRRYGMRVAFGLGAAVAAAALTAWVVSTAA